MFFLVTELENVLVGIFFERRFAVRAAKRVALAFVRGLRRAGLHRKIFAGDGTFRLGAGRELCRLAGSICNRRGATWRPKTTPIGW